MNGPDTKTKLAQKEKWYRKWGWTKSNVIRKRDKEIVEKEREVWDAIQESNRLRLKIDTLQQQHIFFFQQIRDLLCFCLSVFLEANFLLWMFLLVVCYLTIMVDKFVLGRTDQKEKLYRKWGWTKSNVIRKRDKEIVEKEREVWDAIQESNRLRLKIDTLQQQHSEAIVEDKEMSKKLKCRHIYKYALHIYQVCHPSTNWLYS
jgi:regulator of replication initiation timing